jgi:cyclopropane fatty-acyl-phospholipid synthase-like methyltransferase
MTASEPPGIPRAHDFDQMYEGTPPWEIGRPQPAIVALADAGALRGRVLDIGCGTGAHALLAAERGLEATGFDSAPRAIAIAQKKAAERGLAARFFVADALDAAGVGEQFDTVIDSGLFHVFDDPARAKYLTSLAALTATGGQYLLMCFSDRQPGDWGPRRVSEAEIRACFATGWRIESIAAMKFDVTLDPAGVFGWLATVTRV